MRFRRWKKPVGGEPFILEREDGSYEVTWPDGRPEAVEMTADMYEEMVEHLNNWALAGMKGAQRQDPPKRHIKAVN